MTPTYVNNVNVGIATASATFAGDANHDGSSDSATFEITKAPSTVTVTCPVSETYTGSGLTPCTASYSGAGGLSGTLTPTYANNTVVGTATASATYLGDANHDGSSNSATFEITKAPSTVTVTCPVSETYTGSGLTPCTASYSGAGGLSGTLTPTYANNTVVGTATASATYLGDANHDGSSDSATFEITKAPSTVTVTCPVSETYTGSGLTPCTASYSGAGGLSGTLTPTYANNTVVGTATASATYLGDANHDGSSNSATFEITKAPSTVTVTCPVSETYTGSGLTPCTATYSGAGGLSGTLTPTYVDNIDVGTATASATFAGDANHDGSSDSATFEITKASASVILSDLNQVFDGTQKLATVTTDPSGLSVSVTYDGSATAPSAVGSYAVIATITDANYTGSASGTLVISAFHDVALYEGWNLVSFNLHPTSTAIADVLASIAGNYDLVYAWDASGLHSGSGNWLKADNIPLSTDTLTDLDETMGFWIHMITADTLNVVGSVPSTSIIPLNIGAGGWNLVGYPSDASAVLPAAITAPSTMVYSYHSADTSDPWKLYDRSAPDWANDLTSIVPGWGYWIYVTENHTWSIPY